MIRAGVEAAELLLAAGREEDARKQLAPYVGDGPVVPALRRVTAEALLTAARAEEGLGAVVAAETLRNRARQLGTGGR